MRGRCSVACAIRMTVLCLPFVLFCSNIAEAQIQWEKDHLLNSLTGVWTGTVNEMGETLYCENTFTWVLDNAYLEAEKKTYRDPKRKTGKPRVEIEFLKPSGEDRYSTNRFDDHSISSWGTIEVAGARWQYALQNSDGGSEKGIMTWMDGATIEIDGTVSDPSGLIIRTYKYRLKKSP